VIGAGCLALTGGCFLDHPLTLPCLPREKPRERSILRSGFYERRCDWNGILDANGRPLFDLFTDMSCLPCEAELLCWEPWKVFVSLEVGP
jgi:hypothetical protein